MSAAPNTAGNEVVLTDLATEIRTEHEAVRTAAETATHHAIQCGQLLTRAKEGLVHGEWLPWLQEHCHLSERTAQAYMRLARKHGELDGPKAQRVADLPVREAMRAIADERTEAPLLASSNDGVGSYPDDIWKWAERQVMAPFNAFDFENPKCLAGKLMQQMEVPSLAAYCLANFADDCPMLVLIPPDELLATLQILMPVVNGKVSDFDIDFADLETLNTNTPRGPKYPRLANGLFHGIQAWAEWFCANAYFEIVRRAEAYPANNDAYWTAWIADGQKAVEIISANKNIRG